MRFGIFLVAAAVVVTGVSALPTAKPLAEADDVAGPVQALTARNLALHTRSPVIKAKHTGGSKDSSKNSSKSSKSSKSGHGYYKRICSASPTSKALKRSVWKYFKIRSAAAEPIGHDSRTKSSKSNKSFKPGKSFTSGKFSNDGGKNYVRRHLDVQVPLRSSNDLVRHWLGLTPREAEPTESPPHPAKSDSSKSGKTNKSSGSKKSSKSGKSKDSGKGYYVRRRLA